MRAYFIRGFAYASSTARGHSLDRARGHAYPRPLRPSSSFRHNVHNVPSTQTPSSRYASSPFAHTQRVVAPSSSSSVNLCAHHHHHHHHRVSRPSFAPSIHPSIHPSIGPRIATPIVVVVVVSDRAFHRVITTSLFARTHLASSSYTPRAPSSTNADVSSSSRRRSHERVARVRARAIIWDHTSDHTCVRAWSVVCVSWWFGCGLYGSWRLARVGYVVCVR